MRTTPMVKARRGHLAGAVALAECLYCASNIGAESVVLTGSLEKADSGKGDWRLATEEGEFSGKRKKDGPSLAGSEIGGRYQFSCLEEIEESPSGRGAKNFVLGGA